MRCLVLNRMKMQYLHCQNVGGIRIYCGGALPFRLLDLDCGAGREGGRGVRAMRVYVCS